MCLLYLAKALYQQFTYGVWSCPWQTMEVLLTHQHRVTPWTAEMLSAPMWLHEVFLTISPQMQEMAVGWNRVSTKEQSKWNWFIQQPYPWRGLETSQPINGPQHMTRVRGRKCQCGWDAEGWWATLRWKMAKVEKHTNYTTQYSNHKPHRGL